MVASLNKFIIMAGLLCNGLTAFAVDLLPDPTKPAVEIRYDTDADKGDVAETAPVLKKEGLQSIMISPQYRAAVINGETIALGGKIGDATLVEVRENSVVLQGAEGKRVMELFPGVHLNKVEIAAPDKVNNVPAVINKAKKRKAGRKKSSAPVHTEHD